MPAWISALISEIGPITNLFQAGEAIFTAIDSQVKGGNTAAPAQAAEHHEALVKSMVANTDHE